MTQYFYQPEDWASVRFALEEVKRTEKFIYFKGIRGDIKNTQVDRKALEETGVVTRTKGYQTSSYLKDPDMTGYYTSDGFMYLDEETTRALAFARVVVPTTDLQHGGKVTRGISKALVINGGLESAEVH